jgi:hypothetical protein
LNGEMSAGAGRSQEVIIVISDFVVESNLHETRLRFQFMKINF